MYIPYHVICILHITWYAYEYLFLWMNRVYNWLVQKWQDNIKYGSLYYRLCVPQTDAFKSRIEWYCQSIRFLLLSRLHWYSTTTLYSLLLAEYCRTAPRLQCHDLWSCYPDEVYAMSWWPLQFYAVNDTMSRVYMYLPFTFNVGA